jgi:glycosyltransferase involved in cell wall biosynthesis
MTGIPRLQHLGIAMMDEIWAPTRYVADIYAKYKPTHVVGKGLFDALPPLPPKKPNARFTFVTVFDFDSSIERKNPLATALAFQKAFTGGEKVELVIKTSNVNPQHWSNAQQQWERLVRAVEGDRRVRLVTQRYTNDEMDALLRDADCIVSLHRSEGFGYLMSDAMALSVPVIATDYSGNVDFSDETTAFPVAYRLIPVPEGAARWHLDRGEWADADVDAAARRMREVYEDRDAAQAKAARARDSIAAAFSMETFRAALARRVHAIQASRRA